MQKVGLLVGMEWSFPPAFIEEVNRRDQGVTAEFVTLDATQMDQPCDYAVIIDRISHEVPFYRTYLKYAVLQGCKVVNNPFMWTADDKFFGATLATQLGIAHPKTVVLPNREYIPGIDHQKSLRNLRYPMDWQAVIDYVGLPCVLKDAHGGGWRDVYICHTLEELLYNYDNSGMLTMVVQEFIQWDQFVRCICLGQEKVLPIKYDPKERKYHVEHEHLTPEVGRRVVDDSLKLVRALGYDMNSMEWAIKDGVPYAIDFMNPAPDMDIYSLTPHYFEWTVQNMADMAIRLAQESREERRELRWNSFFMGRRRDGDLQGQQAEQTQQADAAASAAQETADAMVGPDSVASVAAPRRGRGKSAATADPATKSRTKGGKKTASADPQAEPAKVHGDALGEPRRGGGKKTRTET